MALFSHYCTFQDVVLTFHSFIDPVNSKMWFTGVEFARGIYNGSAERVVDYFISTKTSGMHILWSDLAVSSDLEGAAITSTIPSHVQDPNVIMIDTTFVDMLIVASPIDCAVELKQWLHKEVFVSIKKAGPYGHNYTHVDCAFCQREQYKKARTLNVLDAKMRTKIRQLERCQKKLDSIIKQIQSLEPPSKTLSDTQEIFV